MGSLRTDSRARVAGEGATIVTVRPSFPALRHTFLESEHAASPIDIPPPLSAAIQSTTHGPDIRRCVPFLCFFARLVGRLEADAAPLASYGGSSPVGGRRWPITFLP